MFINNNYTIIYTFDKSKHYFLTITNPIITATTPANRGEYAMLIDKLTRGKMRSMTTPTNPLIPIIIVTAVTCFFSCTETMFIFFINKYSDNNRYINDIIKSPQNALPGLISINPSLTLTSLMKLGCNIIAGKTINIDPNITRRRTRGFIFVGSG